MRATPDTRSSRNCLADNRLSPVLGIGTALAPGSSGYGAGVTGVTACPWPGPARFNVDRSVRTASVLPTAGTAARVLGLAAVLAGVPCLGTAQASPPAADTYETARIRELVENGARARRAAGEGVASYEAEIRDRFRVGLGGGVFRRERTLIDRARRARVLWTREGTDLVLWTGGEQRVPVAGLDTSADETYLREFAEDLAEGERPIAMLDPREEVLSFGGDEQEVARLFLHPLSDTASTHYRYFTGDTLTISFVGDAAPVRLEEVRVRPRRADARLVAASLWFDLETGQMARASMRPTRPMTLGMDADTEERSVTARRAPPPRSLQFEVQYITIDYLLQEREWWLARRFAFGGEVRIGRWARLPFLIETTLSDYSVNPAEPELTRDAAEAEGWLSGWSAQAASGDSGAEPDTVIAMVPPLDSLETTGLLPERGGLEAGAAIGPGGELTRIRRDLESILSGVAVSYRPRLGLGSWRFNRVEGLSGGASATVPVTARVDATLTGRIGVADRQPRGELSVRRRSDESSMHLAAYRRLADGSDFDDPLDLSSSVKALFSGNDRGQFYDARGAELGLGWTGPGREGGVRIFVEEHRAVEAETSFHLLKPLTKASAPANIGAEEGRLRGIAATFRWSWGTDPAGFSAWGALAGEAAAGVFEYQRASVTLGTSLPTVAGIASALEVGAGTSWNGPPVQRRFYLGGGNTVRGFHESALAGEAFWYGRAELATASPAVRLSVFGDAGWAGPKGGFGFDDPWAGAGVGASLLDGVVRLDLARGVRRGESWRLYLYLDGVL